MKHTSRLFPVQPEKGSYQGRMALARWRTDGKELYCVGPDNYLMAAQVDAKGGTFDVSTILKLFGPLPGGFNSATYDMSPDGQRFLIPLLPEGEVPEPLTLIQNWTAGLKK